MMISQNIINYGIVAIFIVIIIHYLFKNKRKENYSGTSYNIPINNYYDVYNDREDNMNVNKSEDENDENINENFINGDREDYESIENFSTKNNNNIIKIRQSPGCPVQEVSDDTNYYLQKFLLGTKEECPLPPKSTKEFHNDFFKFRDFTQQNSSIREDAVDRVLDLYLDGNLSEARRYPNMKIKDLFDEATKGPNLYERQCVRLPNFDNINPDGYNINYGVPGLHQIRDKWRYKNEKVMNGGAVYNGVYPNDKGLYSYDYNETYNNFNVKKY